MLGTGHSRDPRADRNPVTLVTPTSAMSDASVYELLRRVGLLDTLKKFVAQLALCHRRNDMSDAYPSGYASGIIRSECGRAATLRTADWLCLAAAPTFAIMALLTSILGGGQPNILCSSAEHTLPLSGMTPMYLLMSAFHSPPWLKLIFSPTKPHAHAVGLTHPDGT
jgi:hypothetical protein